MTNQQKWIDCHHHLWDPQRGDYGWLTPELPTLYKPFTPNHLQKVTENTPITGTILVQAAPTVAETDYMLLLAETCPVIQGVVGWVNFDNPQQAIQDIKRLSQNPLFKGVRPMLQNITDTDYILNPNFDLIFQALIDHDLRFEILIYPQGLPAIHTLVQRYTALSCVLNHACKPQISNGIDGDYGLEQWKLLLSPLAQYDHVHMKLSGLLTEAQPNATAQDIIPYTDWILDTFSHNRLIWGSDWPVLNLASDYQTWVSMTETLLSHLPASSRHKILYTNAKKLYNLN